ncbi:MAG: hypothetical protein JSV42_12940 [Chloroflexota bacterium]|nr:MAG: hypothetical protein JSV42_12940 [Chloroflexota bacterium]
MKNKILYPLPALFILIIFLSGCLQNEITNPPNQETVQKTETSTLTPTLLPSRTFTPNPSPTSTPTPSPTRVPTHPAESVISTIGLSGPIATPKAQISGMAWLGETLMILPQYPERLINQSGFPSIFTLSKQEILAYLQDPNPEPLIPKQLSFQAPELDAQIKGYEGYEAIAIEGENIFLTVEANDFGTMHGFLISGRINPAQTEIRLDPASLKEISLPQQIINYSYEALVLTGQEVITIYEANGQELNSNPSAYIVDRVSLESRFINFEPIEYRITDATALDEEGHFWVMNVFMPIEFWLYTEADPIFEQYGRGSTHSTYLNVERMLELEYTENGFALTGREPVQIELVNELNSRNWEALVRLDDLGFLAMTDTYPETILAFIPFP